MVRVCVRCELQTVTEDRAEAESKIETPVLAMHAAQRVAKIAHEGDYRESRVAAMAYERMMGASMRLGCTAVVCLQGCPCVHRGTQACGGVWLTGIFVRGFWTVPLLGSFP